MCARSQEKHRKDTEIMYYETRGSSGTISLIRSANIWETLQFYIVLGFILLDGIKLVEKQ